MKILTIVLCALLLVCVGGAALFYMSIYQPVATENARIKAGMPELDKAKAELKKYKDNDAREHVWTNGVTSTLNAGLSDEIKTGKAEVFAAGNKVIINIAEHALYLPGSRTFSKDSPQLLLKLESLLRADQIKGKDIFIGNMTQSVAAVTKGRKKIPAIDARMLAAERSIELIKYLGKKGINQDTLIAVAYSSQQPEIGFKINANKTMIIIENPTIIPMGAVTPEVQTKPSPSTKGTTTTSASSNSTGPQAPSKSTSTISSTSSALTASPASQAPKPIPIRPTQKQPN